MRFQSTFNVILLCIAMPFCASLPAMAQQGDSNQRPLSQDLRQTSLPQNPSETVVKNMHEFVRQSSNQLTQKDLANPEKWKALRQLQKQRSLRGGPGMDGGGGDAVLSQTEAVRFLDLAIAEGTPLKEFDKKSYEKQFLRFSYDVTPEGQPVSTKEFFSCGAEMLRRQENIFLKALPEFLNLQVVLSNLPLEATIKGKRNIPYSLGSGWTYEISSLSSQNLLSPSLAPEMQRPLASYAVQSVNGISGYLLKSQTLIINSQLYQLLPAADRCALQVHEAFRFLNHAGGDLPFELLLKPLTTEEIEVLTVKVMRHEPVLFSEIPATNLFRALAILGSQQALMQMSFSELGGFANMLTQQRVTEDKSLSTSNLTTFDALQLLQEQIRLDKKTRISEEVILSVGGKNPFTQSASLRRQMKNKLQESPVRIREVMESID